MMPSYQSFTDLDLTGMLKAGDERAFTEIFNRYWHEMYHHALKVVQDEAAAKDIVQDAFVSIWQKHDDLQITTNLGGYLYMVIRSKVLNYLRAQRIQSSFEAALVLRLEKMAPSAIEVINSKETAEAVENGIKSLPAKMRVIFELSRKGNMTHQEIASELHITDHTVKKQINRALKIIRFRLS